MVVEYGVKFVALSGAVLTVVLLVLRLRREMPFARTTEAQQLEAARLLRLGTSDGSESLHPYERGLLHRILAKSRFVSVQEMDLLLRLPDPYQHIDGIASVRGLFDAKEREAGFPFRFAGRYRSRRWRKAAARFMGGMYFVFGWVALLPVLALGVYHIVYVPQAVSAEGFSRMAVELIKLASFTLPVFGYLAFECLRWADRMRSAERLVEAVATEGIGGSSPDTDMKPATQGTAGHDTGGSSGAGI